MIPTLAVISVIVFTLVQLPPGDIVTATLDKLQSQGVEISDSQIQSLRAQYNLDDPMPVQYLRWIGTADFSEDVKLIVKNALEGRLPERNESP